MRKNLIGAFVWLCICVLMANALFTTQAKAGPRKPDNQLRGKIVKKTEHNGTEVLKDLKGRMKLSRLEGTGKEVRSTVVSIRNGRFVEEHLLAGTTYKLRLDPSLRLKGPHYMGEWKVVFPRDKEKHAVELVARPVPYVRKELNVIVRYEGNERPIEGATLELTQIRENGDGHVFSKTDDDGKAHFAFAHLDGVKYRVRIPNRHRGIEEFNPLPDKYEYPPLKSYESEVFSIEEVGKNFTWEVTQRPIERSLVVHVKGQLTPEEEDLPLRLYEPDYPENYFEGVREQKNADGTFLRRFWSRRGDEMVLHETKFGENGSVVYRKHSSADATKYVDFTHLERIDGDGLAGVFYNLSPGKYFLRIDGSRENVQLARQKPIIIGEKENLPVEVTTKTQDEVPAPRVEISGTVQDEHDRPVQKAQVKVHGVEKKVVTTDGEGHFQVSGLWPTIYSIVVTAEGYKSKEKIVDMTSEQQHARVHLKFKQKDNAVVRGVVKTKSGQPVPDASVFWVLLRGNESEKVSTDTNGKYAVTLPKRGAAYGIIARANLGEAVSYEEKTIRKRNAKLDIVLPEQVEVEGKIKANPDLPDELTIEAVLVMKNMLHFPTILGGNEILGKKGEFSFKLPPGNYRLWLAVEYDGRKVIELGGLEVSGKQDKIMVEEKITRKMLDSALNMQQFGQRAMKKKRKFSGR